VAIYDCQPIANAGRKKAGTMLSTIQRFPLVIFVLIFSLEPEGFTSEPPGGTVTMWFLAGFTK
jgi:hypothetical protein